MRLLWAIVILAVSASAVRGAVIDVDDEDVEVDAEVPIKKHAAPPATPAPTKAPTPAPTTPPPPTAGAGAAGAAGANSVGGADDSSPAGDYRTLCGQRYFFSKEKVTQEQAFMQCARLSMILADLETAKEIRCIITSYIANYKEAGVLITSGGRDTSKKNIINRFVWRGTGGDIAFLPEIPWMPGEPHPSGKGHNCVALYVYKKPIRVEVDFKGAIATFSGIFDTECNREYTYICEASAMTKGAMIIAHQRTDERRDKDILDLRPACFRN